MSSPGCRRVPPDAFSARDPVPPVPRCTLTGQPTARRALSTHPRPPHARSTCTYQPNPAELPRTGSGLLPFSFLPFYYLLALYLRLTSKLRALCTRPSVRAELPRAVSLLLAWEGALVAGVCLAALGHVALTAYAMERHDERVRWMGGGRGPGTGKEGRARRAGCVTGGLLPLRGSGGTEGSRPKARGMATGGDWGCTKVGVGAQAAWLAGGLCLAAAGCRVWPP